MSEDDEDGLGDACGGMSEDETAELEENFVPMRLILTKVSDCKGPKGQANSLSSVEPQY
jgi:hypothetical protein